MTRLMLALGVLSLTTVMQAAPAFADPTYPPDLGVVDFCKNDVPTNHPDLTIGNCIGSRSTFYRTLEGWAQHVCFFIQSQQPDDFYAVYDTYDECVRDKASALLN
jgi:hypothetical protein